MPQDISLAYLGIEVPDPASLTPFFGEVIGLARGETAEEDGTVTWRDDQKVHRVLVHPGPANDAVYIGLESASPDAFDRVQQRLEGAGYEVQVGSAAACKARRVGRLISVSTPWGIQVELVEELEEGVLPYSSPLVPGGFLTGDMGFGHAVFATTAFEESHAFVTTGLGLVQSDWLETEIAEGVVLEVRFYHCNARHHSLALAKAPFDLPQTLHHFMIETNRRDDVGVAFDRAWDSGLAIPNGLGRHDNDEMFSFYVQSPAGFLVEVGHGARVVTDPWDGNRRYDQISAWGHQALR
jgi:2,3-dihydroxybiphenyl 1,2-dioxygenase